MKKPLIMLIVMFFCLAGCSPSLNEKVIINLEIEKIDKIEVLDGKNGKTVVITDQNTIKKIKNFLNEINVNKINDKELKGYQYSIKLIKNEKTINTITLIGNVLKIDNNYYLSEKKIDTNILKELF